MRVREWPQRRERGAISTFDYFAYGSNMLTERLRARCPGAYPIGVGVVSGYTVEFQKRGTDDSAKATLVAEVDRHTYGVVFEIPERERRHLDLAEGSGYEAVTDFAVTLVSSVWVSRVGVRGSWENIRGSWGSDRIRTGNDLVRMGTARSTTTYLVASRWRTKDLYPYHWYKALVVNGALEHGLPTEHIDQLRATASIPDSRPDRPGFLTALEALDASDGGSIGGER